MHVIKKFIIYLAKLGFEPKPRANEAFVLSDYTISPIWIFFPRQQTFLIKSFLHLRILSAIHFYFLVFMFNHLSFQPLKKEIGKYAQAPLLRKG